MRRVGALLPLVALPSGWLAGRWLWPAPLPVPEGTPAAPSPLVAPVPAAPVATRCPDLPVAASEGAPGLTGPPSGWDPLTAEQALWKEVSPFVDELGGGEMLTLDCARWPCVGTIAWSWEAVEDINLRAVLSARWPGATLRQSAVDVDGVELQRYFVAFHDAPLHPDLAREVALRRIGIDIEEAQALEDFARERAPGEDELR